MLVCFLINQAAKNDRNTKPNSVICGDCDGNGKLIYEFGIEDLGFANG